MKTEIKNLKKIIEILEQRIRILEAENKSLKAEVIYYRHRREKLKLVDCMGKPT